MLVVVDYSVGNVRSVCNAFRHIGCDAVLSKDPAIIKEAIGLVLPGVAAFGYAVAALGDLAESVRDFARSGRAVMGICVGYQMLFESSCEYGQHKGIGLIKGNVGPIPQGRVIPHMGWNLVKLPADMNLFDELGSQRHFYFAHSFYAQPADEQVKIAYTDYGFELAASVQKDNIFGTQFHPEKSGNAGLKVLENFYNICRQKR
jgi:imidazole glycerol-phosphate synthase subunit HisH